MYANIMKTKNLDGHSKFHYFIERIFPHVYIFIIPIWSYNGFGILLILLPNLRVSEMKVLCLINVCILPVLMLYTEGASRHYKNDKRYVWTKGKCSTEQKAKLSVSIMS